MRLATQVLLLLTFGRFWRHRLADQYAPLLADIGLSRAEEQAFLALRRSR